MAPHPKSEECLEEVLARGREAFMHQVPPMTLEDLGFAPRASLRLGHLKSRGSGRGCISGACCASPSTPEPVFTMQRAGEASVPKVIAMEGRGTSTGPCSPARASAGFQRQHLRKYSPPRRSSLPDAQCEPKNVVTPRSRSVVQAFEVALVKRKSAAEAFEAALVAPVARTKSQGASRHMMGAAGKARHGMHNADGGARLLLPPVLMR